MKNIVERMKNLTNMATFHVTSEGSLTLTVETDMVSVTSHFEDLHVEKSSKLTYILSLHTISFITV
jgi:Hus1-like protein